MTAGPRFLTLPDVAEVLNTSLAQVTALVKRGELRPVVVGVAPTQQDDLSRVLARLSTGTVVLVRRQG